MCIWPEVLALSGLSHIMDGFHKPYRPLYANSLLYSVHVYEMKAAIRCALWLVSDSLQSVSVVRFIARLGWVLWSVLVFRGYNTFQQ